MKDSNRARMLIEKFTNVIQGRACRRLGTTFTTRDKKYFYDTGTGKVFECSEDEYNFLEDILQGKPIAEILSENKWNIDILENILILVEKENILQAPLLSTFNNISDENLKVLLEEDLQQVILELTETCNLRCKYCIYNDYNPSYRDFKTRDMTWEIAKKAIDYTNSHSGNKVAVTFYGGEPLIKFDLMKKCIEYSLESMKGKELSFSFSTNLTLMTRDIARFVASIQECSVLCSIDGPKYIHDSFRVRQDGAGSFEQAIRGLKYLVDEMGESASERIIINTVVCPPYTKEKLDMIKDFFESLDWLPEKLEKKCDYVEAGTIRNEDIAVDFLNEKNLNASYKKYDLDSIRSWALDSVIDDNDAKGYASGINKGNLIKIHNRMLTDRPQISAGRNGCCIPGNRRIYVQVDGNFLTCEKIGKTPNIGNVFSGIDINRIKKYYFQEYDEKSINNCSDCWAIKLCGICYATCYLEDGIDIDVKNDACDYQRKQAKGELMAYYQLLEKKPEEIQKIKDIPII